MHLGSRVLALRQSFQVRNRVHIWMVDKVRTEKQTEWKMVDYTMKMISETLSRSSSLVSIAATNKMNRIIKLREVHGDETD